MSGRNYKDGPGIPGDDSDPIAHLDFWPSDPETIGALSDLATLDAIKMAETEERKRSWWSKHPRTAAAVLAISALMPPIAGETMLGGYWENQTHSSHRARAESYLRCEQAVEKDRKAGAIFVRLSTLTEQEQKDCGYSNQIFYSDGYGALGDITIPFSEQTLDGGEIIAQPANPTVRLPDPYRLGASVSLELSDSQKTQYGERILGTLAGLTTTALIAYVAVSMIAKRRRDRDKEEANT